MATQEKPRTVRKTSFVAAKTRRDCSRARLQESGMMIWASHYDAKAHRSLKGDVKQLASELEAVNATRVSEMPRGLAAPKTLEELEEFRERIS